MLGVLYRRQPKQNPGVMHKLELTQKRSTPSQQCTASKYTKEAESFEEAKPAASSQTQHKECFIANGNQGHHGTAAASPQMKHNNQHTMAQLLHHHRWSTTTITPWHRCRTTRLSTTTNTPWHSCRTTRLSKHKALLCNQACGQPQARQPSVLTARALDLPNSKPGPCVPKPRNTITFYAHYPVMTFKTAWLSTSRLTLDTQLSLHSSLAYKELGLSTSRLATPHPRHTAWPSKQPGPPTLRQAAPRPQSTRQPPPGQPPLAIHQSKHPLHSPAPCYGYALPLGGTLSHPCRC
eukprot:1160423-Pelagomonas_calceolata.AAC.9